MGVFVGTTKDFKGIETVKFRKSGFYWEFGDFMGFVTGRPRSTGGSGVHLSGHGASLSSATKFRYNPKFPTFSKNYKIMKNLENGR